MRKFQMFVLLCLLVASMAGAAQVAGPLQESDAASRQPKVVLPTLNPGELKILPDESVREALSMQVDLGMSPVLAAPTVPVCVIENQAIVGGCPGAGATTNVPTVIVPVVITISQGASFSFNPTTQDNGCLGTGNTALSLFLASPLISNANTFVLNGENEGSTQFIDAFTRAQFSAIKAAGYNVNLSPVSVGATLSLTATGNTATANVFGVGTQCGTNNPPTANPTGDLGVVNVNSLGPVLQNYITAHGIPSTTFTYFLLYNTVMSAGAANNGANCCILGFHTAFGAGPNTYGIGEFEGRNQTVFGGVADVSVSAHEIGEWLDDPFGTNTAAPVTPWGNIGQVSGCQSNLEVGDPLSGTLGPAVLMPNGFTYHLQEEAFFSWFTHDSPSLGSGGKYSSNGTFSGFAKACPPGGTN